jgi:hypothetical protein
MTHPSATELLVLHAVRLKGHADTDAVAARFDLDTYDTYEYLLDAQAHGWVSRSSFADLAGWSLTDAGRQRNESELRDELDKAGARDAVDAVHEEFLPFNATASRVFTAAQLGHDGDVHGQLADIADGLRALERRLVMHLTRFVSPGLVRTPRGPHRDPQHLPLGSVSSRSAGPLHLDTVGDERGPEVRQPALPNPHLPG